MEIQLNTAINFAEIYITLNLIEKQHKNFIGYFFTTNVIEDSLSLLS